jgi:hypothetical protein
MPRGDEACALGAFSPARTPSIDAAAAPLGSEPDSKKIAAPLEVGAA